MNDNARDFVLVHGGWHGGWCWSRVATRLASRGHRVFAPSLTGLSDRHHLLTPDVNLTTHITDIANLIEWEAMSDVVLVGHSYGGFVISGVAERVESKIDTMVFLDAFVPKDGECARDYAPELEPFAVAGLGGASTQVVAPVPAEYFAVNEEDRPWVDRLCTAHPLACMTERIALTGARDRIRRKAYIRAADFPVPPFDHYLAEAHATPGWEGHAIATSHDAMIEAPDQVAALLLSFVA
ncbi:MAG: alpha/beta fold hydrolase [Acidimicrobiales bacterium]